MTTRNVLFNDIYNKALTNSVVGVRPNCIDCVIIEIFLYF